MAMGFARFTPTPWRAFGPACVTSSDPSEVYQNITSPNMCLSFSSNTISNMSLLLSSALCLELPRPAPLSPHEPPALEADSHAKVQMRKKVRGLRDIEKQVLEDRR